MPKSIKFDLSDRVKTANENVLNSLNKKGQAQNTSKEEEPFIADGIRLLVEKDSVSAGNDQAADEEITKEVIAVRKQIKEQEEQRNSKTYTTTLRLTSDLIERYSELRLKFKPYGTLAYDKILSLGLDELEKMPESKYADFIAKFKK